MIQNKLINGLAIGIILPLVMYPIFDGLDQWIVANDVLNKLLDSPNMVWAGFKESTLVLFMICANLVPTFLANKRRYEEFVRGIMIPTVIYCFIWFFDYKGGVM